MRTSDLPGGDAEGTAAETRGRSLIVAPIVHSAEDLGSLAGDAKRRLASAIGEQAAAQRAAAISAFWVALRARVSALRLDWTRVRLYQDGLPVCEHELAIVKELAHKGHPNHALLLELVGRGAALMGTEDAALVVREYRRAQRLAQQEREGSLDVAAASREGELLLRERDAFIASRIDETLRPGDTALLFIGLLHRVEALLAGKMDVRLLEEQPLSGAQIWRKG